MSINSPIRNVLLGVTISLFSHAALSVPSEPDFSSISACDVTLEGECADDFDFAATNDDTGEIGTLFPPADWTQLLKTDAGSAGSWMDIAFSLTGANVDDPAAGGDFTLSWTATPADILPKYVDLVFALKASPGFAGYLFESELLDDQSGTGAGTGSSDGTWEITFLNNGGNLPDLSHLSLYIRAGEEPGPDPDPNPMPVPGTLLLIGLGLIGLRFKRRKNV